MKTEPALHPRAIPAAERRSSQYNEPMVGSLLLWLLVHPEADLLAKSKLLVDYDK